MPFHIQEPPNADQQNYRCNHKKENSEVENLLQGFYPYNCHSRAQHHDKSPEVRQEGALIGHAGTVYCQPVTGDEIFFNLYIFPGCLHIAELWDRFSKNSF